MQTCHYHKILPTLLIKILLKKRRGSQFVNGSSRRMKSIGNGSQQVPGFSQPTNTNFKKQVCIMKLSQHGERKTGIFSSGSIKRVLCRFAAGARTSTITGMFLRNLVIT